MTILDIQEIQKILPHRYPFLLVDKIIHLELDKKVIGIKSVTTNEPFFPGHFPGRPIMPGVLIIEAMAQTGGILMLNSVENPEEKLVVFMGIDNAKFRKQVVPGDQLILEAELINQRSRFVIIKAVAKVGNNVVAEAELKAAIVDRVES